MLTRSRRCARKAASLLLVSLLAPGCSRPTDAPAPPMEAALTGSVEPILPIPLVEPAEDPALVALGDELFFSTIVSEDGRVSCGSCHPRERAFVDGSARSEVEGRPQTLTNTTTLLNVRYFYKVGWFGQSDSLEEHLDGLIKSRKLMATSWDSVTRRLRADPKWVKRFSEVFSDGVSLENAKRAVLAYERSLTTPNAPFDRFLRGDEQALLGEARQGYALFKNYGCVSCHQGVAVGANMLETFGVMRDYFADRGERSDADRGRMNVTGREEDRHVFRVPSLRNVATTAPYFHDGSAQTLDEAVKVMARYQLGRELESAEVGAIVAFLGSLTGEYRKASR